MGVRVAMGLEHAVNNIISEELNAIEDAKDRTYLTSVAGLN